LSDSLLQACWPAPDNILAGTTLRGGGETDLPAKPSWLNQVHGSRAVMLDSGDFAAGVPEADAVIGRGRGAICAVRTADCLPVLLCSTNGQEIAAVHAGWRGLAAGVIEATVVRLESAPAELLAWIGPAISQSAFEVGDEVRQQFLAHDAGAHRHFLVNDRGRWQADLKGLARDRLQALGIVAIYTADICTYRDAARCYSYRRDGPTGRHLSFVYRG